VTFAYKNKSLLSLNQRFPIIQHFTDFKSKGLWVIATE